MPLRHSAVVSALALGLALSACDQPETPPSSVAPGRETGDSAARARTFAKEALAIKARHADPRRIEAELRALIDRLGYPQAPAPEAAPARPAMLESSAAPAKAAGVTTLINVKSANMHYFFANTFVVSVPNGATLAAGASVVEAGLDPMLVGFYKTESTLKPGAYRTKIIGYVDDNSPGDISASFSWKNTTGVTKSVRLVGFAYPGTYGKGSLVSIITNPGTPAAVTSKIMWVSATPVFENYQGAPPEWGCVGPHQSRIKLESVITANLGSTVIAVNASTLRGGYIRETNYELNLNDILPAGAYNMILPYIEGGSKPQPDPVLSSDPDKYYGSNTWLAFQNDRYSCESPE